jgi:Trk K+ transport system NAD-binding subunit
VAGRPIADTAWPTGTVVVAIQRGDRLIFPEPITEIREGDVLSALVPKTAEERLRAALGIAPGSDEDAADAPLI